MKVYICQAHYNVIYSLREQKHKYLINYYSRRRVSRGGFTNRICLLRTQHISADYAILRGYMEVPCKHILFVKPPSDTLLRYSTCFTKRHHLHLYNLLTTTQIVLIRYLK
jgi:hypothetical protein